jgi:two-component system, OmpR family, response regulator RegX3
MKTHILVVEDDPLLARLVDMMLVSEQYKVTTLSDPRRVVPFLAKRTVDLILLDVTLPYIDGFTLATQLRRQHPDIPIIFVTARGLPSDKAEGFARGADDYLSKPFEPAELLARIQAVLRRYRLIERNRFGTVIRVGAAMLDLSNLRFIAPDRLPVTLTPTEMKVLECLMRHANAVVSAETLIERTWGHDYEGEGHDLHVYLQRLRAKIEKDPRSPQYIQTMRGAGFIFRDAPGELPMSDCTIA